MKTAVLLIGNIRDWESCKPSFKQALGDHDIFVSTYDVRYNYHPINKPAMGDLENEIISPEEGAKNLAKHTIVGLLSIFSKKNLTEGSKCLEGFVLPENQSYTVCRET